MSRIVFDPHLLSFQFVECILQRPLLPVKGCQTAEHRPVCLIRSHDSHAQPDRDRQPIGHRVSDPRIIDDPGGRARLIVQPVRHTRMDTLRRKWCEQNPQQFFGALLSPCRHNNAGLNLDRARQSLSNPMA